MNFILTLVASNTPISTQHFEVVEDFLAKDNSILKMGKPLWLHLHKAVDIPLSGCLTIEQIQKLRCLFDAERVDVFCTRTENRRKKLFLADMDSTIVTSETLDDLAGEAGLKETVSAITVRAMKGELDFFEAIRERVALLKGLSADSLKRTLCDIQVSDGAETLVKIMKRHGVFCVLVSGGFTYFTQAIAGQIGFDAHHGNTLIIENDRLLGEVGEPILGKEAKLKFLQEYAQEQKLNLSDTLAIGDGANDLPMLEAAGLGVGYRPKPLLEDRLLNCIRHTDLISVLYVQGYTKEEIIF